MTQHRENDSLKWPVVPKSANLNIQPFLLGNLVRFFFYKKEVILGLVLVKLHSCDYRAENFFCQIKQNLHVFLPNV